MQLLVKSWTDCIADESAAMWNMYMYIYLTDLTRYIF